MRADQVTQVRGYADQLLRVKNNPYDPSNRRISILVKNNDNAPPPQLEHARVVGGASGAAPSGPAPGTPAKPACVFASTGVRLEEPTPSGAAWGEETVASEPLRMMLETMPGAVHNRLEPGHFGRCYNWLISHPECGAPPAKGGARCPKREESFCVPEPA